MDGVVIVGPTAVGKSALGMELAEILAGEIVSIDSRQVYRGLNIGTAKATTDDISRIRHHCIDILDISEKSNAEWFAGVARSAMDDIRSRGKIPILVGGSGLYLRAVIHGLFEVDLDEKDREIFENSLGDISTQDLHEKLESIDPVSSGRIHSNDRYRIVRALEIFELTGISLTEHFKEQRESKKEVNSGLVKLGLEVDRSILRSRIAVRTRNMYKTGWPEEVTKILSGGANPDWPGLQTLGYPETIDFVRGESDKDTALSRIATITGQYAKRQMTWFKKEADFTWLDTEVDGLAARALNVLDTARCD